MAYVKITSEGTGQDTRITIDGKPVAACTSVVWMVHGRHGRAVCVIGYRDADTFDEKFEETSRCDTAELDVRAEIPDGEVRLADPDRDLAYRLRQLRHILDGDGPLKGMDRRGGAMVIEDAEARIAELLGKLRMLSGDRLA